VIVRGERRSASIDRAGEMSMIRVPGPRSRRSGARSKRIFAGLLAAGGVTAATFAVTLSGVTLGCDGGFAPPAGDWAFDLGRARGLRILYAGVPEEPRGERFVSFLAANFDRVEAIDFDDLTAEVAAHHDVVVADWRTRWSGGEYRREFEYPKQRIPHSFATPIVLVSHVVLDLQEWGTKLRSW
jgi:hypothetical protein